MFKVFEVPCHPPSSPTFIAHCCHPLSSPVLPPTHLCLMCSRTSCPLCCLPHASCPPHSHLVRSRPTCRSLTCVSCPPLYVSSPSASCSPHWVLVRSLPMHMPLTCVSFPPPYVSSPMHPAHLISTQLCLISQVGLLPVHAAHLTTSQLGLSPVSQWMVCMARCGEVCNRGM